MVHWALAVLRARRLALALFAALALTLAAAAGAQAAVTHSSITSPTDPFFGFDQGQTQNVTISGTSNGTTGDQVQILCYSDNGSTGPCSERSTTPFRVGADGTFSVTVSLRTLEQGNLDTCRLRAVPAPQLAPTTGLSAFTGPRTLVGTLTRSMNGSTLFDYFIQAPQLTATDQYLSYSDCGLDNSYLDDPTVVGQADVNGFYCNDLVDNPAASDSTRSGIEVDGQSAYGPYSANTKNSGATGLPALTLGPITQNPSNGDLTFDETDPIVICEQFRCTAFSPERSRGQAHDHPDRRRAHGVIDDAYSSTDGKSHTVNLLLENQQDFAALTASNPVPGDVDYRFPGASTVFVVCHRTRPWPATSNRTGIDPGAEHAHGRWSSVGGGDHLRPGTVECVRLRRDAVRRVDVRRSLHASPCRPRAASRSASSIRPSSRSPRRSRTP